jgi:hypothetical protein
MRRRTTKVTERSEQTVAIAQAGSTLHLNSNSGSENTKETLKFMSLDEIMEGASRQ